jgi:hypothetical protein
MADEFDDVKIPAGAKVIPPGAVLDDFFAYMRQHEYIYVPSGDTWPAASINGRFPKIKIGEDASGKPILIPPATWLDRNRPVEQLTWAPGLPMMIEDRLMRDGGWVEQPGARCFNLYRPPKRLPGDPEQADPWLDHVARLYPDDAEHIIWWLAQRVQSPHEKINHALLLGSDAQGIGKDTMLAPVREAVGTWNWQEATPHTMLASQFNGYLKGVVLRISELKDLGDADRFDRFTFYKHLKSLITTPPEALRINEKNRREYYIPSVVAAVCTTNEQDGLYLPPEDRRVYPAWTKIKPADFPKNYWPELWSWYRNGGYGHVAAFLGSLDLSGFDAKAPPPRNALHRRIINAHQPAESAELADALDKYARKMIAQELELDDPERVPPEQLKPWPAVTLRQILPHASYEFEEWLKDRKNRRSIAYRFKDCGYVRIDNPDRETGLWVVRGERVVIYVLESLDTREQFKAVAALREEEAQRGDVD